MRRPREEPRVVKGSSDPEKGNVPRGGKSSSTRPPEKECRSDYGKALRGPTFGKTSPPLAGRKKASGVAVKSGEPLAPKKGKNTKR